jgi:hypothetical protein
MRSPTRLPFKSKLRARRARLFTLTYHAMHHTALTHPVLRWQADTYDRSARMLHLLCLAFSPAPRLSVGASRPAARATSPVVALFGTPTKLDFAELDLPRCASYLRTFPAKFRGWGEAEWKLFGLPPLSFSPRPIEGGVELVYYLSEAQAKQQGRGGLVEDGGECQRCALAHPCTRPHTAPAPRGSPARRTARDHRRCGRCRLLRPCAADRDPLDAGFVRPLSARGSARGRAQLRIPGRTRCLIGCPRVTLALRCGRRGSRMSAPARRPRLGRCPRAAGAHLR